MPRTNSGLATFMLPLKLAEGLVLAGVELECRGCGRSYRLTKGQGRAGAPGGRIALAARSQCPHCATAVRFLVVVDLRLHHASVQRVSSFGLWLAEAILEFGRAGRRRSGVEKNAPLSAPAPAVRPAVIRFSAVVIGRYADHDIPAWIEVDGLRCAFFGVASEPAQTVRSAPGGEVCIPPGLVYHAEFRTEA